MIETQSPQAEANPEPMARLPGAGEATPGHSGIGREQALEALVAAVRRQHGAAVVAVLFYGSCLRSGDPATGIADFYVVVESYRGAGMGPISASMNRLLPPNVFYLETPLQGHTLRAKYAVVRQDQFIAGVRGEWLLPYLWGRFAQPSQIAWTRDESQQRVLQEALTMARQTFLRRATAALRGEFTVETLWQEALLMSYRTELRAERRDKIRSLVHADPEYYQTVTAPVLADFPWCEVLADGRFRLEPTTEKRGAAGLAWRGRQILGKLMSVLRLFKSLFTFSGAVDYAVWKIQRHSGQAVEVPDWARRYPWLGGWVVLWRLWRRGQLR